jgi:hypothetical protein
LKPRASRGRRKARNAPKNGGGAPHREGHEGQFQGKAAASYRQPSGDMPVKKQKTRQKAAKRLKKALTKFRQPGNNIIQDCY